MGTIITSITLPGILVDSDTACTWPKTNMLVWVFLAAVTTVFRTASACSNLLIGRLASETGSPQISYTADSGNSLSTRATWSVHILYAHTRLGLRGHRPLPCCRPPSGLYARDIRRRQWPVCRPNSRSVTHIQCGRIPWRLVVRR